MKKGKSNKRNITAILLCLMLALSAAAPVAAAECSTAVSTALKDDADTIDEAGADRSLQAEDTVDEAEAGDIKETAGLTENGQVTTADTEETGAARDSAADSAVTEAGEDSADRGSIAAAAADADTEEITETEERAEITAQADNPYGNTAKGFVYRLYACALGRTPDSKGLESWTKQLTSGSKTGAEVPGALSSAMSLRIKSFPTVIIWMSFIRPF